jgi:outer membrane autotransporter protein
MADAALLELNPQLTPSSDLGHVLDMLDTMVASGNTSAADELGASLAGASTAVLGMAAMGDVERQLRAIRNRTTTMGVDQTVVNHDMPYFNAWINAEGHMSEMGDDGTLGGYKLNSWGGTVGFDVDIDPTFTAGLALTAMYGDLDATGADKATGNMDTTYVSAFARYCASAWTHTFVATAGMGDISLDRTVNGTQIKGETESMSFGLMYEVGRVFALDEDATACIQPVFNVAWRHASVDGYTEKGSDAALEVGEQSLDTITFGLGARVQAVVGESMYNRTSIFECRLLAKADVGDRESAADVALGGGKAEVKSAETGAFGLEAGAGLTIPLGDEGSSIFMDASVELRADYTNVNGTVGYRINF